MVLTRGAAAVLTCLGLVLEAGAAGPPPRWDLKGDVLPLGAVARLESPQLPEQVFFELVLLSADGRSLLVPSVADARRAVYSRWDLQTGTRSVRYLPRALGAIDRWALFPDGNSVLLHSAEQQRLSVVNLVRNRLVRHWPGPADVSCLAVGPGGRLAAVGRPEGQVEVHDLSRGKRILTIPARRGGVAALAFTAEGSKVAIEHLGDLWRWYPTVRLVEVHSGKVCRELTIKGSADLALAPDGRHVAASLGEGEVWVWELASGRKRRLEAGTADHSCRVGFRGDGKQLVVTQVGGQKAFIVDVATGKQLRALTLPGLDALQTSFLWTADGKWLVGIEPHSLVRTWSSDTGRPGPLLPPPAPRAKRDWDRAPQLGFSASGQSLTLLDEPGKLFCWETGSGRQQLAMGLAQDDRQGGWSLTPDAAKGVEVQEKQVRVLDVRGGKLHTWPHGPLCNDGVRPGPRQPNAGDLWRQWHRRSPGPDHGEEGTLPGLGGQEGSRLAAAIYP
jgi:WD40 repeat protein